jgi:hypothetical protein
LQACHLSLRVLELETCHLRLYDDPPHGQYPGEVQDFNFPLEFPNLRRLSICDDVKLSKAAAKSLLSNTTKLSTLIYNPWDGSATDALNQRDRPFEHLEKLCWTNPRDGWRRNLEDDDEDEETTRSNVVLSLTNAGPELVFRSERACSVSVQEAVIDTLAATKPKLQALSLVWCHKEGPDTALYKISKLLPRLEILHLATADAGEAMWHVDHARVRKLLSGLTNLETLGFDNDAYNLNDGFDRTELDYSQLFGRYSIALPNSFAWFGQKDKHAANMLREACEYAEVFPRLTSIRLGQHTFDIETTSHEHNGKTVQQLCRYRHLHHARELDIWQPFKRVEHQRR